MKKIIHNLIALGFGFLLVIILLEVIFRFILPASSTPFTIYDPSYKINKFDVAARQSGTYTIGRFCKSGGNWKINNEGWNSMFEYEEQKDRPRIAIIGDSYIEAFQVDTDKNVAAQLWKNFDGKYDVYSFGQSGAPISQYYQYATYVNKKFNPDILIFNVVHNDFDESLCEVKKVPGWLCVEESEGQFYFNELEPGKEAKMITKILMYSATVRYLLLNLKIQSFQWKGKEENKNFNANVDVNKVNAKQAKINGAISFIMTRLKKENENRKILFVIDGLRKEIYNGENYKESSIYWMNKLLEFECKQNDFGFIDLSEHFKADFDQHQKHFELPYDWHWNEYGHEVVAETIVQFLLQDTLVLKK